MKETNLGKFVVENKSRKNLNNNVLKINTDLGNEVYTNTIEDINLLIKGLKKNTKMQVEQEKVVNE